MRPVRRRGVQPVLARYALTLATVLAPATAPSHAAGVGDTVDYDTLKAVYLERFARFVEWPAHAAIGDSAKPFVIAVLGQDGFARQLERIYRQQTILGKPVEVLALQDGQAIPTCHLLFIGTNQREGLLELLARLKRRPVLTVSDSPGFGAAGVHFNLYSADNKLRFEINEPAAKAAGLQIGYQLLSYARSAASGRGPR
jgi:hypothetical protein